MISIPVLSPPPPFLIFLFLVRGPYCYPKCSYSGEKNLTSIIWEGMGDKHHGPPPEIRMGWMVLGGMEWRK